MSDKSSAFDKLDIRRAAYSMIANHGSRAIDRAAERARNLLGEDLTEPRTHWERVAREIMQIERLGDRGRAH